MTHSLGPVSVGPENANNSALAHWVDFRKLGKLTCPDLKAFSMPQKDRDRIWNGRHMNGIVSMNQIWNGWHMIGIVQDELVALVALLWLDAAEEHLPPDAVPDHHTTVSGKVPVERKIPWSGPRQMCRHLYQDRKMRDSLP